MSIIGIIILLISTISILLVLLFHKWTKKLFRSYWFYLIFSILYLIYFILIRYANDLSFVIKNDFEYFKKYDPYTYSFKLSKVFLLDLCPFVSIFLPISLLIDKTRNTSKVISIFGIIGGLLTIYGNLISIDSINVPIWKFILLGENPNYIMFSSHYFIMILSFIVLLNSKKFTKWSILGTILFILFFICYVLLISQLLDIQCNTTGLRIGDWINPYKKYFWYSQYAFLNKILNLLYPYSTIFWYSIASMFVFNIILFKNIMTKDEKLFTKLWWPKLNRIDSKINKLLFNFENSFKYLKKDKKMRNS